MDYVVDSIHKNKIFAWVFLVSSQAMTQNNVESKLSLILGAVSVVIYSFFSYWSREWLCYKIMVEIHWLRCQKPG